MVADREPLTPPEAAGELLRRRRARVGLMDFTLYTFPTYQANWHHRVLARYLDAFARREIKRLMVFAPPQTGKSELVSRRLPAYLLGRNPDCKVIATSYAADLASQMNRDVQRIIESSNYGVLFPETRLYAANVRTVARGSWLRNSDVFEVVGRMGRYRSAGVGGGITGMAADFAIIDDPIKNEEEAYSPVMREALWNWYCTALRTRLATDGAILLTNTRWHRSDLAGRLLQQASMDSAADQWTVLVLPAIKEGDPTEDDPRMPGLALWENRFSTAYMHQTRRTVGPVKWAAVYQQKPKAEGGAEWPDEYFAPSIWFDDWPPESQVIAVGIALDPSKGKDAKHGDYSAYVMGRATSDGTLWVDADMANDRNATLIVETGVELCRTWRPHAFVVETNSFQELLVPEFQRIATAADIVLPIYPVDNRVKKEVRIRRLTPWLSQGKIRFKAGSPGARLLVEQLRDFPNAEHDDGPDALEMLIRKLSEGPGSETVTGQIGGR